MKRTIPFVLALCLLLGVPLFTNSSASSLGVHRPVKLILQWSPQSQFAGYYMALEKGIYQKYGLNVEIIPGGPDRNPKDYLSNGQADFATMFLTDALIQRDKDTPLVNLGQVVTQSNQVLIAWKEQGINQVPDLDSRRISIWEGGFRTAFLNLFQAKGISPSVIPQYYSVNLFLNKGVDACSAMYYNEYHMIYQAGIDQEELETFFVKDYGFGFPEDGIYCLEKTFQANPDICRAFTKATLEGWRYAAEHPDETLDIVMKYVQKAYVPTNQPHMKWMLEKILPSIVPVEDSNWRMGHLSRDSYENTAQSMKLHGSIKSYPAYEVFYKGGE